jgi:hypothetical protein
MFLGEASFALKHLLTTDRYSSGQPQKIPVYASKQLLKHVSHRMSRLIGVTSFHPPAFCL